MRRLNPAIKFTLIALVVGGGVYLANVANDKGYFKRVEGAAASVPDKIDLPTAANAPTAATPAPTTTNNAAFTIKPTGGAYKPTTLVLAWNAELAILHANGGGDTAKGSNFDKAGVKMHIERQDDYGQMIAAQAAFAKELAGGNPNPASGAAFTIIMGDGLPAYMDSAKKAVGPFGQQLEAIAGIGYSRGEDKCMLPAEVKKNPQKARGSLIGAVLRDGDQHICLRWAGDNDIPVNPDEKTYDPDAMNFIAVDAFTAADEKLIAGYCEDRPVVKKGKGTGETRKVCQNGTATWTPGDVKIAREKGGMVAVASTKEYMWQMPATLIGNKQWMAANRTYVENMLASIFMSADQIKSSPSELRKAAEVAAIVFKEEKPEYWARYYNGVTENDKTGMPVALGGSTVNNLADNLYLFGLNGNDKLYERVYNTFGKIDSKYYPEALPTFPAYASVVNTTYLQALVGKTAQVGKADTPDYAKVKTTEVFAQRSLHINFETGKATFMPGTAQVLDGLLSELSVSGLKVQIAGHTDSIGNSASNLDLSKRRAEAVAAWIRANAGGSFPADRLQVRAYGDTMPVAPNTTDAGRALNRRVDITLLQ